MRVISYWKATRVIKHQTIAFGANSSSSSVTITSKAF